MRGVEQIHLYISNGIVVCYDAWSRQSPSLQGIYGDVKSNILDKFKEEDVKWCLVEGSSVRSVSRAEWIQAGRVLSAKASEANYATKSSRYVVIKISCNIFSISFNSFILDSDIFTGWRGPPRDCLPATISANTSSTSLSDQPCAFPIS